MPSASVNGNRVSPEMWWRSAGREMIPAVWSTSRKSIWIETNVDFHTLKLAVQPYCEGNDAEGVRALQISFRFSPQFVCRRINSQFCLRKLGMKWHSLSFNGELSKQSVFFLSFLPSVRYRVIVCDTLFD